MAMYSLKLCLRRDHELSGREAAPRSRDCLRASFSPASCFPPMTTRMGCDLHRGVRLYRAPSYRCFMVPAVVPETAVFSGLGSFPAAALGRSDPHQAAIADRLLNLGGELFWRLSFHLSFLWNAAAQHAARRQGSTDDCPLKEPSSLRARPASMPAVKAIPPPGSQQSDPTTDAEDRVRLHITPFDAALLPAILPASVQPRASEVSFHTLDSFPDKRYGFVTLPTADAERVRRRLHGAIVKGTKIRIEAARASDMAEPVGPSAAAGIEGVKKKDKSRSKSKRKDKKRTRDGEEIAGVELEEGRKVKRGWTTTEPEDKVLRRERKKEKRKERELELELEDGSKVKEGKKSEKRKKMAKSQFTDEAECLFKTVLPVKAVAAAENGDDPEIKKKRKKDKAREVVMHEFEKTTKFPTFLKDTTAGNASTSKKAAEYVDGKGWVDEDGNVVEEVKTSRPAATVQKAEAKSKRAQKMDARGEDGESASSDSPVDAAVDATPAAENGTFVVPAKPTAKVTATGPVSILKSSPARPKSSSSAKSLTIKIPPPPSTPVATESGATTTAAVHPLEALYKRPRKGDGEQARDEKQGFNFFGSDDAGVEGGDPATKHVGLQMPMTPYTRADFEWRGQRSAAPTPDTAFASRSFKFWAGGEDKDGEGGGDDAGDDDSRAEDEEVSSPVADAHADEDEDGDDEMQDAPASAAAAPAGDKEKWFWEQRGDLNRAWRTRRRTYAKEKRYRGNKARADRA
jgi:hypothetical protein